MAKFTESVRNGSTKAPQQRGFKLSNWEEAFKKFDTDDSEDKDIYKAGLWFSDEFSQVRKITEEALAGFRWSTPRDRLLAIVGYATREWGLLKNYVMEQIEKTKGVGYFLSELDSVPVKSPFYKKVDPTGSIESLVDGLRYPLGIDFCTDPAFVSSGGGTVEQLAAFMNLIWTGQHYHMLEQVWLDCVWNGLRLNDSEGGIVIEHRDKTLSKREAVSEFRRTSLMFEVTHRAAYMWRFKMSDETKKQFLSERKVFSIFKRNERFRVKAADALRFQDRSSSASILQKMLTPEHVEPLMNRRINVFRNLTLFQVAGAYDLISQIPEQIATYLPKGSEVMRPEDLLVWAPIFSRSEMIKALAEALKTDISQSEWLLELMTHTRAVREQCWFRPFIDMGGDELTIILAAVDGVNYARLYDWLLARDPKVEQELGPLFETFIHSRLNFAFQKSPIRNILAISKAPGVVVYLEKGAEEIDLAFLVGNKLFICELKSTQYPTEPLEHLTYRNRLDEAAEQARRKASFVTSNIKDSIGQLGMEVEDLRSSIEVHPLVITSSSLFAGWSWKGIGVSDWQIIYRFFVEGKLELLGYHNDDGDLVNTMSERFYQSSEEAESKVADYFIHAPQVRLFEAFLKTRDYALPVFSETEKPKKVRDFVVQLPHEILRKIVERKQQTAD